MKAYKVTLLVIDHDGVGDRVSEVIENTKFPNHCISPKVMEVQEADIGDWHDGHPLNSTKGQKVEFERLFSSEVFTESEWAAFHDVVIETLPKGAPPPTPADLHAAFDSLPEHIKRTGRDFGLSDTVFRDKAYERLMKAKES